jgi:hypothetical protein
MASFIPVRRVITVDFRPAERPKGRIDVVVTPDYLVIRSGDIIEWVVQSLSEKEAARVTIGNIKALGAVATVKMANGKLKLGKPTLLDDRKLVAPKGGKGLTYDTHGVELGYYKFDVMVDGKVVCDPDVEIRGPRN